MQEQPQGELTLKASRYSLIRYIFAVVDTLYALALLFIFLKSGLSKELARQVYMSLLPAYLNMPVYFFWVFLGYSALTLPLVFLQSFYIEHKFGLSNQNLAAWLADQFKSAAISFVIALVMLSAFYLVLDIFPRHWWLAISAIWIFFSLFLARIMPVVIIPLFFKYKKLQDQDLRRRILSLADKYNIKLLDVYEIDFSKKTLKANAAFVGFGSTRRVILADTLKSKYSYDEIEVILAHEFAHYKLKHLWKLVLANSCASIGLFFLIFKTSAAVLGFFNISGLSNIAGLPAIFIYMILFGIITQPLENWLSRIMERSADKAALANTGLKSAFISMMEKLAGQNLADPNPNWIIKVFFFNHPPVSERIEAAQKFSL